MTDSKAVGFLFERTTRIIKLNFHQLFKNNNSDITPEQWVILDILNKEGVLSQKQLADHSFKDAPSISRILTNLTKKGLLARTNVKQDKRISAICLTSKGESLIEELLPKVNELRSQGIKGISESELEQLMKTMDSIFNNYAK